MTQELAGPKAGAARQLQGIASRLEPIQGRGQFIPKVTPTPGHSVGRAAVVAEDFGHELVLLDLSKGRSAIDREDNVNAVGREVHNTRAARCRFAPKGHG